MVAKKPFTLPSPPADQQIANQANEIRARITPLLKNDAPLPAVVALTVLAAHILHHDDAKEEDFLALARMAWRVSTLAHASLAHKACIGENAKVD